MEKGGPLAEILAMEDPQRQGEAIAEYASSLEPGDPALMDAFVAAVAELDPGLGTTSRVKDAVLPRLSAEQVAEAVSFLAARARETASIRDQKERFSRDKLAAWDVARLAPYVREGAFDALFGIVESMGYDAARGHAIFGLAPHVPPPLADRLRALASDFSAEDRTKLEEALGRIDYDQRKRFTHDPRPRTTASASSRSSTRSRRCSATATRSFR